MSGDPVLDADVAGFSAGLYAGERWLVTITAQLVCRWCFSNQVSWHLYTQFIYYDHYIIAQRLHEEQPEAGRHRIC